MVMRKKTAELPKFHLSKEAIKIHQQSVKESPDPSKILDHACDYRKLLVLKNHPSLDRIGMWLKERIEKWVYISPDDLNPDGKSEIFVNVVGKTIPKLAESNQWVYYLEAYLEKAAKGFCSNFLKKYYREKDQYKEEDSHKEEDEDQSEHSFSAIAEKNREKSYLDILLDPSITEEDQKLIILIGDGPEKKHDEIGRELGVSAKTVQRRLKKLAKNETLIENLRMKIPLGKNVQEVSDQESIYSHKRVAESKNSIQCSHCKVWFKPKVKPADIECPFCYKKLK
jgi:RNA polymerase sigma factor (sigma-70 family)